MFENMLELMRFSVYFERILKTNNGYFHIEIMISVQGRPQDLAGGGSKNFFFQIWKFACREAMRFAKGVRGHAPPIIFFKMVQFGAFWCIFWSDFVLKKYQ